MIIILGEKFIFFILFRFHYQSLIAEKKIFRKFFIFFLFLSNQNSILNKNKQNNFVFDIKFRFKPSPLNNNLLLFEWLIKISYEI